MLSISLSHCVILWKLNLGEEDNNYLIRPNKLNRIKKKKKKTNSSLPNKLKIQRSVALWSKSQGYFDVLSFRFGLYAAYKTASESPYSLNVNTWNKM